ncbi:MAG: ribonuclease protein component [Patescibacteria group bacterium]|nr:ribonuclease protein component [Patescibacteria group bacterium]
MVSIRTAENSHRSLYRCAVVVSKKISKSAVKRNRIRRRLYEIVRKNQGSITVSADIVITVHNELIATIPHAELESTICKLLTQAGVYTAK